MYVDDVSFGANCEDDTYELYLRSMAEGSFNLRKYVTMSASLQQKINDKERDATVNAKSGPDAREG